MKPDTYTSKGAKAWTTTGNAVLDLFSSGAAKRQDQPGLLSLFQQAWEQDPLQALRVAFYLRDVRGGQGERKSFRTMIEWLANNHKETLTKNLHLISEYGRWDDIFSLFGTMCQAEAISLIRNQLDRDLIAQKKEESVSLLGKWMPREGTAGHHTAAILRTELNMDPRHYRKMVVSLSRTVEQQMCANKWSEITFRHIPSRAMKLYRNAFEKHDVERWKQYLEGLIKGTETVHASTIFPHELVHDLMSGKTGEELLSAQWAALPNYSDTPKRILPVCDTSGSMGDIHGSHATSPIKIAVGLSLYLAERNTGPFQNMFMTFDNRPQLIIIQGDSIKQKLERISAAKWGGTTDLQATFTMLLEAATAQKLTSEQMPEIILIISDMQFDGCTSGLSSLDHIRTKYYEAGYEPPVLVFWNVNAAFGDQPAHQKSPGVMLASGCSPSIMQGILSAHGIHNQSVNPLDLMIETINSERYQAITI